MNDQDRMKILKYGALTTVAGTERVSSAAILHRMAGYQDGLDVALHHGMGAEQKKQIGSGRVKPAWLFEDQRIEK